MFVPFLIPVAASAIALGVYKLGALSVWVTVLSLALKSVSLLALAAAQLGFSTLVSREDGTCQQTRNASSMIPAGLVGATSHSTNKKARMSVGPMSRSNWACSFLAGTEMPDLNVYHGVIAH
jgi:hypothetical protein